MKKITTIAAIVILLASCSKSERYCYRFYNSTVTHVVDRCDITPQEALRYGEKNKLSVVKL